MTPHERQITAKKIDQLRFMDFPINDQGSLRTVHHHLRRLPMSAPPVDASAVYATYRNEGAKR